MELDPTNYHTWFLHEGWFLAALVVSLLLIIAIIIILLWDIPYLTGALRTIANFLVKGPALLMVFLICNYWSSNVDEIFGLEKFSLQDSAARKNERINACLEVGKKKRLEAKDYDFIFRKIHLKRCEIYVTNREKELERQQKRQIEKMKKDGIRLSN